MAFTFNTNLIKEQVENAAHGNTGSTWFSWKDVKEVSFRLLPWYRSGELQSTPFFLYTMHYEINGKHFPCNNKNGHHGGGLGACPVCMARVRMFQSGNQQLRELAYQLQTRDRVAFQIVEKGAEDKGIQVMSIAQSYVPELLEILQDAPEVASFGDEGSYITGKVVKVKNKSFSTKAFSLKTGKSAGTFHVPLALSGEMEDFVEDTQSKVKGLDFDDAVLAYIKEHGYDLEKLAVGEKNVLAPSEVRALLAGTPGGSTALALIDAPRGQAVDLAALPAAEGVTEDSGGSELDSLVEDGDDDDLDDDLDSDESWE